MPKVSTELGSAVHGVMEILAHKKLKKNRGHIVTKDYGKVQLKQSLSEVKDLVFHKTIEAQPTIDWTSDKINSYTPRMLPREFFDWLVGVGLDSKYSPEKLDIIQPERRFEYELPFDWAKYSYLKNGELVTGNFKLTGLIDLLYRDENGDVIFLDYKTGKPHFSWAKNREYLPDEYLEHLQLSLYYYVIRQLYPELGNPKVKLWWMQADDIVELDYGEDQIEFVLKEIRQMLDSIRNLTKLEKNITFKCRAFCSFGRSKGENRTFTSIGRPELAIASDGSQHITQIGEEATICEAIHTFSRFRTLEQIVSNIRKD